MLIAVIGVKMGSRGRANSFWRSHRSEPHRSFGRGRCRFWGNHVKVEYLKGSVCRSER